MCVYLHVNSVCSVCTTVIDGGTGGPGGLCPPTHHKGGDKNVYVEYCMHGCNGNIDHEFSTMAFSPPHLPNHSSAYDCFRMWDVLAVAAHTYIHTGSDYCVTYFLAFQDTSNVSCLPSLCDLVEKLQSRSSSLGRPQPNTCFGCHVRTPPMSVRMTLYYLVDLTTETNGGTNQVVSIVMWP